MKKLVAQIIEIFWTTKKGYYAKLSLALIPIVIGSGILAGVLEKYKSDEAMITSSLDAYTKLKEKYSECHAIHNSLFLEKQIYAGYINKLDKELAKLLNEPEKPRPPEYSICMSSFLDQYMKYPESIKVAQGRLKQCHSELNIQYEDVAILTGNLSFYEEKNIERLMKINSNYGEEAKRNTEMGKHVTIDFLMKPCEVGMGEIIDKHKEELFNLLGRQQEHQVFLGENEKKRFDIEQEYFGVLKRTYLLSIKERIERDYFEYLIDKIIW